MLTSNMKGKTGKTKAKSPDFKVCPACQTRNKAKWDFCARCGESLADVAPGLPAGTDATAIAQPVGEGFALQPILLGALLVASVGGFVYFLKNGPPKPVEPDPVLFAAPTLAPSPFPPPPPSPVDEASRLFGEGSQKFRAGDYAGAVPLLAQAVGLAGDRSGYRRLYGMALAKIGEREKALDELQLAASADPSPGNLAELCLLLDEAGQKDRALAACSEAVAKDQTNARLLAIVAQAYTNAGKIAESMPYRQKLAEMKPRDAVVWQELGVAYEKAGDPENAIKAYRYTIELIPSAAITRGLLAELLFKQGRKDEAVAVFREGVQVDPEMPLLHRGLGSLLERTGQVAEAIKEYREYARLAPDAPDAKALEERAARLEAQEGGRS